MKRLYPAKAFFVCLFIAATLTVHSQVPTTTGPGFCDGVVANFNTSDQGFNAPSIYGSIFDSSLYYHAGRGYWTDYLPPFRTAAPVAGQRVMTIISPPFANPNPVGTFNVGFYYIVGNPVTDRFQVRIISVTQTSMGTVTNVEASSGVQSFAAWTVGGVAPYTDATATPAVPDPTPFMGTFQGRVCIRLVDADITNGPNTTYRVETAYLVNEPLFAVFDDLSVGPFNAPLPVDFIGLVANRNASVANTVDLRWDVAQELNVAEYQIERSTNGSTYELAGAVNAKGKSIYSFTDNNATANATLYYRVRSVDIDGRSKYSGVLRIAGNSSYGNNLQVYPVPAKNDITVQHRKLIGKARIIVTSLDGRVLQTVFPTPNSSNTPVTIGSLAPGLYMLRLDDEGGYTESVKFLKE
jgi:hypothetical protein